MEVWKDIYFIENGVEYDYRGLYQVSNFGRVKSLRKKREMPNGGYRYYEEKILKPNKNNNGYLLVCLYGKKQKYFQVHRLVAHHFINGYFEGATIDHIDTNPLNNHVLNLRWCTRKENNNNELTRKHMSEAQKRQLIVRYDLNMNLIDIKYNFEYGEMGFDSSHISKCCKGRLKTHNGFIFKYHEGE